MLLMEEQESSLQFLFSVWGTIKSEEGLPFWYQKLQWNESQSRPWVTSPRLPFPLLGFPNSHSNCFLVCDGGTPHFTFANYAGCWWRNDPRHIENRAGFWCQDQTSVDSEILQPLKHHGLSSLLLPGSGETCRDLANWGYDKTAKGLFNYQDTARDCSSSSCQLLHWYFQLILIMRKNELCHKCAEDMARWGILWGPHT